MSGKTAKQERKLERQHKIFWGSSYDRGLDILLFMWPDVLEKFPDAELHVCYGWELFDIATRGNPERARWKESVISMLNQKGIVEHGRVGKQELEKIRKSCGIWAYPTYFPEIDCITAKDAQRDGLVPITMTYAALSETVQSGIKLDGDIKDKKVQQQFLNSLLLVMGDSKKWTEESNRAKEFASNMGWNIQADKWIEEFKYSISEPLVSIITPTIRTGFWNIMAENLSKQTYKNFEWIIVDDYKIDRFSIAEKYAKKYNLKIRYIRGDKITRYYKRAYGLVRANNKAWKASKGELLVILQDFIIIPEDGIEKLVDLHRHNPDSLIAPVDVYYNSKEADKTNLEDWWNGETNVLSTLTWKNPRVKYFGIRQTENPYDFELNYGAIPKKILDELNGWWEFLDDGLGYDNTEIAHRALNLGKKIIVDDTNIAKCINLWPVIGGTGENILNRERQLNPPRYQWLVRKMKEGKLPTIRDEKLDDSISLPFEVPKEIEDKDCAKWIEDNLEEIIKKW